MAAATVSQVTRNPDGSVVLATRGKLASNPSGNGMDTSFLEVRPITKMSGVKIIPPKGQGTGGKSAYA